ncbi:MAG TPA: response regulator transcription factor [Blastocatellia bacterium]|nr:response regulator transcription factor [Blastocatellia bacterium]
MTEKPVILVVDDERQLRRLLQIILPPRGYEVRTAPGGNEALDEMRREMPSLVLLDLSMPEPSGLEVCRRIREFSDVPIIMLSERETESDKVAALEMGADDYVTKPFGTDELVARIRAILRRVQSVEHRTSKLCAGDVMIDLDGRRVAVGDRQIRLTPKEFEVLNQLVRCAGKVVTHRTLLRAVWGTEATEQTDYLRVFINQIRNKIEPDPRRPQYIVTEPWVGYRFVPRSESVAAE